MQQNSTELAAFDFDGTISTKDTFFPFLLYAFGKKAVYTQLAIGLVGLLRVDTRKSVRDRLKASLVRGLFKGASRQRLELVARDYAQLVIGSRLRPKALECIRWHREQGHRCIMVSASLDIYLQYIAQELGFHDLLCTRLSKTDDAFDGELIGNNCRRAEKVSRMQEALGDLRQYRIHAYGDSAGDREMLTIAAERHFRPFE